jgi:hypothetical protein
MILTKREVNILKRVREKYNIQCEGKLKEGQLVQALLGLNDDYAYMANRSRILYDKKPREKMVCVVYPTEEVVQAVYLDAITDYFTLNLNWMPLLIRYADFKGLSYHEVMQLVGLGLKVPASIKKATDEYEMTNVMHFIHSAKLYRDAQIAFDTA